MECQTETACAPFYIFNIYISSITNFKECYVCENVIVTFRPIGFVNSAMPRACVRACAGRAGCGSGSRNRQKRGALLFDATGMEFHLRGGTREAPARINK